jgi:hypothetical protein
MIQFIQPSPETSLLFDGVARSLIRHRQSNRRIFMFMNICKSPGVFSIQNGIITVDFDAMSGMTPEQRLELMIAAGKYGFANPNITPEKFPVVGTGVKKFRPRLLHFGRTISSKDAEHAVRAENVIRTDGTKSGTFIHGLAFGAVCPDEQRRYRIACLGGSCTQTAFGQRCVVCLGNNHNQRDLLLYFWDDDWDDETRFLVVQELYAA